MHLGIFSKTFARPTLAEVFAAIGRHCFETVQFNLASAALPTLPESIPSSLIEEIVRHLRHHHLTMAAVSGTFNLIHPNPAQVQDGLRRLRVLAGACQDLRTSLITLCTGTRDATDLWRRHPDNDSPEAWRDLVRALTDAVGIAEQFHLTLGIEPEQGNVVSSAIKARRLLDELQTPRLKIVMDAANLLSSGDLPRMREILTEAFDLLGPDIVLAHAKDLGHAGENIHTAAGLGRLDFDLYLDLLRKANYDGPLILHHLTEGQVSASCEFLRPKLEIPRVPQK